MVRTDNVRGEGIPPAAFELLDTAPADPEPGLLGLWTPVPLEPAEAAFFEAFTAVEETAPVWRADYPSDPERARTHLEQAQRSLDAAESALAATPSRLDAFVMQRRTGLAFAPPAPAEEDLTVLLGLSRAAAPELPGVPGEPPGEKWERAFQSFRGFAARLQQIAAHYAWVETRVGGRLVGQTGVAWTGDMHTVFLDPLDPDQVRLHQRTLDLALASRKTLVRMAVLTVASAVKLSVLLVTPGGIALALPAVLRFINQIRKELASQGVDPTGT
jgi:hypothetical protein